MYLDLGLRLKEIRDVGFKLLLSARNFVVNLFGIFMREDRYA